jgi:hypothetical protein
LIICAHVTDFAPFKSGGVTEDRYQYPKKHASDVREQTVSRTSSQYLPLSVSRKLSKDAIRDRGADGEADGADSISLDERSDKHKEENP